MVSRAKVTIKGDIDCVRGVVSENDMAWIFRVEQFGQAFTRALHQPGCGNRHAVSGAAGIASGIGKVFIKCGTYCRRFGPGCCCVVEVDGHYSNRSSFKRAGRVCGVRNKSLHWPRPSRVCPPKSNWTARTSGNSVRLAIRPSRTVRIRSGLSIASTRSEDVYENFRESTRRAELYS